MEVEKTFLEKYGTLIIAVIALAQPWIIFLWKKLIKSGTIDFFKTGNLEVGFSDFASTLGINGTLRGLDKELYVSKIELDLKKLKNSSAFNFEWAIFRDTKFSLGNTQNMTLELPNGFIVSPQSPKSVNIQFHDTKQKEELRPLLNELNTKWTNYLNTHYPYDMRIKDTDREKKIQDYYNTFCATTESNTIYAKLNNEFYWEKSTYELTFKIFTSKPNKSFSFKYSFNLTEEDCESLRLNVISTMNSTCRQNTFNFQFVYPSYNELK